MHNPMNASRSMPAVLNFEGAELKIIDLNGVPWITSGDLGSALGYKRGGEQVARLYRENSHEFCAAMSQVIDLRDFPNNGLQAAESAQTVDSTVPGNLARKARIFSPRGAHLIGMFSRTAKAGAFRRWVLDVLEGIAPAPQQVTQQPIPATQPGQSLAALVADNISGPALSEIPAILAACSQRLSGAMCLPHWQSAPAPSEMAEFIANTRSLSRSQLDAVTVAAVRRLMHERGSHGVQQMLREVNGDYLLVNEPELVLSLYRARGLPQGVAQ